MDDHQDPDRLFDMILELRARVEALEKKAKKPKPEPDGPSSQVRKAFLASYERAKGYPYPAWGAKENRGLAAWLKSVSLAEALEYAVLYPHWKLKKAVQANHPFWMLPALFVELVAHRKNYPEHAKRIQQANAMERVLTDVVGKEEEMKLHGELIKRGIDSQIGFGGVQEIPQQGRALLPGAGDPASR